MSGDQYKEYSFTGSTGSLIIDYGCETLNSIDLVNSFEIDRELFLKHMPFLLKLKLSHEKHINNIFSLLLKLKWNDKIQKIYLSRLRRSFIELINLPLVINDENKKINDMVYSALRDCGKLQMGVKDNRIDSKNE